MSARETLKQIVQEMSEDKLQQLLAYAQLIQNNEEEEWRIFARQQFARCYGPDEPEYTEADIKWRVER